MTDDARKHLTMLERSVHLFLAHIDVVMLRPDSETRGEEIAALCNALDMQNKIAARFGLGMQRVGGKPRKIKR